MGAAPGLVTFKDTACGHSHVSPGIAPPPWAQTGGGRSPEGNRLRAAEPGPHFPPRVAVRGAGPVVRSRGAQGLRGFLGLL